jgi:hypothetical protein
MLACTEVNAEITARHSPEATTVNDHATNSNESPHEKDPVRSRVCGYIHVPIRLHGIVLNWLRTGTTLPFNEDYVHKYSPANHVGSKDSTIENRLLCQRVSVMFTDSGENKEYAFTVRVARLAFIYSYNFCSYRRLGTIMRNTA